MEFLAGSVGTEHSVQFSMVLNGKPLHFYDTAPFGANESFAYGHMASNVL